jgi:hypothetical protein
MISNMFHSCIVCPQCVLVYALQVDNCKCTYFHTYHTCRVCHQCVFSYGMSGRISKRMIDHIHHTCMACHQCALGYVSSIQTSHLYVFFTSGIGSIWSPMYAYSSHWWTAPSLVLDSPASFSFLLLHVQSRICQLLSVVNLGMCHLRWHPNASNRARQFFAILWFNSAVLQVCQVPLLYT